MADESLGTRVELTRPGYPSASLPFAVLLSIPFGNQLLLHDHITRAYCYDDLVMVEEKVTLR
jgi:hypothetical protein